MIAKQLQDKGFIAKLFEQGVRILLVKECKKISNIKIDIISNFTQIIKGKINKITIFAEDINYKGLLFDKFELEANHLKINLNLKNKELSFVNNPIIKFNIYLSQSSIRNLLLSDNWIWISNMISKEILNKEKIEDIKISNNKLLMNASEEDNSFNQGEQINIKTENGKLYLENQNNNKTIQIPIEQKIYIQNVYIEDNLIIIFANSVISL